MISSSALTILSLRYLTDRDLLRKKVGSTNLVFKKDLQARGQNLEVITVYICYLKLWYSVGSPWHGWRERGEEGQGLRAVAFRG